MDRQATVRRLIMNMTEYYSADAKRIQHFIKVHAFAVLIGRAERLSDEEQFILECAAAVHDIGIRPSEEKYGRCDGHLQEKEGVAPAGEMLKSTGGFTAAEAERICFLVGHHHTLSAVDGIDFRILAEADMLVNLYEDGCSDAAVRAAISNVFRTESGTRLCRIMYGV